MKRIGLVVLYVLLCVGLVIPMGNLASPVSAAADASASVSPAAQTVTPGGTFTVDIVVDPAGKGASAGEVDVQFDPAAMSASDIVAGALLGPSPLVGSKVIDNVAGTIQFALARVGATTPPTTAGIFATISFTGKDELGTFPIAITFVGISDEEFNDITLSKSDGSVTFPAPRGTIEVASPGVAAPYTITGPAAYSGTTTGTGTWIDIDAPVGDYTIEWGDVAGYVTPASETKNLGEAGTITFIGDYAPAPGTIEVTSTPSGATFSITGPVGYTGTATDPPYTISTGAPPGDYTIAWGDMTGYTKPEDETKTLAAGGKITFVGVYTEIPLEEGTIHVTSPVPGATFTITGAASYSGSAPQTFADAPAGDYTIAWGDMAGYTKPDDETLTLVGGGTITFTGVYTEIPLEEGTIEVASIPGGATYSISGAALYTGTAAGTPTAIATDAPAGNYTIVWWDMTGYTKPADETLTLAGGGTITFTGVYTEIPPQVGTIRVTSNLAAPFVVTGPAMFTGTADWTKTTSHLGEYSIVWGHVDGYATPSSGLPQTLTAGGTITFNGIYEALPTPVGTIEVTSNVGAPYTVTGPANYTGMGDWIYVDSPVGTYTIHWGDVAGYVTPADQTLTLVEGGTIVFSGNYVPPAQWTHAFRDPRRGTVLYINTCNKTFCFTAPDGFTTGTQQANWMTYRKGRINFGWRSGKLRVSGFAHEGVDYGQCWVTKNWRLKYRMIDPMGFEA